MIKFRVRMIAALMACLLVVLSVVPVSASGFDLTPDTASVTLWTNSVKSVPNAVLEAVAGICGVPVDVSSVFWHLMDLAVGRTGPQTLDYMNDLVGRYQAAFNGTKEESCVLAILKGSRALGAQTLHRLRSHPAAAEPRSGHVAAEEEDLD